LTYRLSQKAGEDIRNLYVFGVQTFGVDHAERYYAGLFDAFEFLAHFPLAARLRPELRGETRAHPYQSHLIFYRQDGADVFIQRVRHSSEDWGTHETL
jgi:toxin ParE1/3/4